MAETLTEIARKAKQTWGYPEEWMDAWAEALTIKPEFIERNETWVAAQDTEPIGFYVLSPDDDESGSLDHFWIRPESMGVGVGSLLLQHARQRASALGLSTVVIVADPNAEPFYVKHGARRTGVEIGSVCGSRRELPILAISPA